MMNIFKKGKLSDDEILRWLLDMRKNPYIPEADFAVTGVFRAQVGHVSDYYFSGVNVQNIDHRISTCSEEACIAAMATGAGKQAAIAEVWVMGAPKNVKPGDTNAFADAVVTCCGGCRQQIVGFAGKDVKIHSVTLNGNISTTTVGEFLPGAFTLLKPPDSAKTATAPSAEQVMHRLVRNGALSEKDIFSWLKDLASADDISHVSQSMILGLGNGAYVAGTKVENVAFDDISAAQSALAIAVSKFGLINIKEVWIYTTGHDGQKIPPGSFGTLPMSALQALLQMAQHGDIPIHFFADDGSKIQTTLSGAAQFSPTSEKPFYKKA